MLNKTLNFVMPIRGVFTATNFLLLSTDKIVNIAESDNLGSTDSEVKKILTLHLPITEYEDDASDDASAPHSDSEPQARLRPAHPTSCQFELLNLDNLWNTLSNILMATNPVI